jgi:hypothetical protein
MLSNQIAVELSNNFIADLKKYGKVIKEAYLFNFINNPDNINLVVWADEFSPEQRTWIEGRHLIMDKTYLVIHAYNSREMERNQLSDMVRLHGYKII